MKLSLSPWGVYSVWRRHATVFMRTWLVNLLPPMTEPILFIMSFGLGLGPVIKNLSVGGRPVSYPEFIAPGLTAVAVLFQSFFEGAYGSLIRLRYQKIWTALLRGPLGFDEIFGGDWLWAATRGFVGGFVTGLVCVLLGLMPWTQFLWIIPLLAIGAACFAGLGLWVAGAVRNVDQVNVPVFLGVLPMFTLCGTFFPRENLPGWLAGITQWLPLAPLIDLLRDPLQHGVLGAAGLLALLLAWGGVSLVLARRAMRPHVLN